VWSEEVNINDLVKRDGLYYKKFSDEPFTGNVVGLPRGESCCEGRGRVVNGKREGRWTFWYENGQLLSRINHKNGKREGLYERYYESGQVKVREYYKNGEWDGLYEWYYESGQLEMRGHHSNGKRVGKEEYYNEDGTPLTCREYREIMIYWSCLEED
tara:strand:+ start:224 stop:694 length:471 start_codon:yes stop_codon:yes gene_type:complete